MTKKISLILGFILFITNSWAAKAPNGKKFPAHWGEPPALQTRDLRPLPGGYGQGSSTLAKWIGKNLILNERESFKFSPSNYLSNSLLQSTFHNFFTQSSTF